MQEAVAETTAVAEPAVIEKAESISKEATTIESNNWHVIGGCFRSRLNAENFVEEMKSLGFKASVIGQNSSGLYMVSVFDADDFGKASDTLPRVKSQLKNGAWVFKK